MHRSKQTWRPMALSLLLVMGLALLAAVVVAPLGQNPALAQSDKLNVGIIKRTLYILKDEYVEKVNYNELLKSGVYGVKVYLKKQKLSWPNLDKVATGTSADANLQEFQQLLLQIMNKYQGKIKAQEFLYYALKGMMFGLKDPYSVALEPREFRHLKESMSGGNFGGVGVYIELDKKHKNQLVVVEPIDETPAARAGLKSGDWILQINGVSTKGLDLDVAANRIRGPVGSTVKLLIQRDGKKQVFQMTRSMIHVKSATGKLIGPVGYIRLRFFGEDTGDEVEQALSRLERQGARAIVIDVRNNGGGYINAAREVCNKFLPSGQLIVSVVNYRKHTNETHKATGSTHRKLPMACLINEYSASASEITAGALKDTGRAILVGTKSFGKGSVQTLEPLPDGGALKFTTAHYLTPSGHNINKKGIVPDVLVKMEPSKVGSAKDVQLEKAVAVLKSRMAGGAH